MSNSSKICTTGYYGGQAVTLGLVLLALHFPAGAQPAPGANLPPIVFGQPVQGTLTSTDKVFEDGSPFDTYTFTVPAPGPFFIKANSPDIPLYSALYFVDPVKGFVGLQDSSTFRRGQALGYFGVLNQAGRYAIDLGAFSPQQPTGSYTLSLTNTPPPAAPPAQ